MIDFAELGKNLTSWYVLNKRELPWRNTKIPYNIWVSEIILQQTRVNQGLDYYIRFTERFPDVQSLAVADIDDVMKVWQGLGYYSRARNMHAAAKQVHYEMNGKFPDTSKTLSTLKGVGRYTSAAIASLSFGESVPVVDGNVYRVLARHQGIYTPIDSTNAYTEFASIALNIMRNNDPGTFNQAIMELGALICSPQSPDCDGCPIAKSCYARLNRKIDELPVKQNRTKTRNRYFNYLVITNNKEVLVQKRSGKDIWKSLFDFLLVETESELKTKALIAEVEKRTGLSGDQYKGTAGPYVHKLSHQVIIARFLRYTTENLSSIKGDGLVPIKLEDIENLAVPRLIDKYLKNEFGFKK